MFHQLLKELFYLILPKMFSTFFNKNKKIVLSINFLKVIDHWVQMANSDRFGMLYYDFGPEENFWRYGSERAPVYDLKKYKVDTFVYCAEFDSISVLGDCKMFAAMMPNLKRLEIIDDFTHADFTIGLTANEKVQI